MTFATHIYIYIYTCIEVRWQWEKIEDVQGGDGICKG